MKDDELDQVLIDTFNVNPKQTRRHVFRVRGLEFLKLRDVLLKMGHIVTENFDAQEYVATIGAGFLNSNTAYIAFKLEGNELYVSVSAKEGLISQHTCEGAVNELKNNLKEFIEEE